MMQETDVQALADDYVLGLLEPREAAEVEEAMERNSDLKEAIGASRERFLPLDIMVEPAALDPALWTRIESGLPLQEAKAAANVTPAGSPAAPSPAIQGSPVPGSPANDNRTVPWRSTALAALAASLLLAVGLGVRLTRTAEPMVMAVLLDDGGRVRAVVEDFGNENASVRLLDRVEVPPGKTIQVWTLPSRDTGPVSLGLLDGARSKTLQGPSLPSPRDDQLYELTLEQEGGSPTGRPTGPILAKGFAKTPI